MPPRSEELSRHPRQKAFGSGYCGEYGLCRLLEGCLELIQKRLLLEVSDD